MIPLNPAHQHLFYGRLAGKWGYDMSEYKVEIHETSSHIVTVNAENEDVAIDEVREAYEAGEYVLDYNDFQDVEFEVI